MAETLSADRESTERSSACNPLGVRQPLTIAGARRGRPFRHSRRESFASRPVPVAAGTGSSPGSGAPTREWRCAATREPGCLALFAIGRSCRRRPRAASTVPVSQVPRPSKGSFPIQTRSARGRRVPPGPRSSLLTCSSAARALIFCFCHPWMLASVFSSARRSTTRALVGSSSRASPATCSILASVTDMAMAASE